MGSNGGGGGARAGRVAGGGAVAAAPVAPAARVLSIAEIKNAVPRADSVGRLKNGNIMLREGHFYTFGRTSADFAAEARRGLPGYEIVGHGQHHAPFRGGATTAQGSHWWVEAKPPGA